MYSKLYDPEENITAVEEAKKEYSRKYKKALILQYRVFSRNLVVVVVVGSSHTFEEKQIALSQCRYCCLKYIHSFHLRNYAK